MDCKVMHSESLGQKTWKVFNNNKKFKTNLLKIYVCFKCSSRMAWSLVIQKKKIPYHYCHYKHVKAKTVTAGSG